MSVSSASGPLLGLVFLVVLFAAALWVLRRSQTSRTVHHSMLQIIGTQAIGPAQQLLLVRAGHKTLLLGASSQSVNLITELQDETDESSPNTPASAITRPIAGNPATAFTQVLAGWMRR